MQQNSSSQYDLKFKTPISLGQTYMIFERLSYTFWNKTDPYLLEKFSTLIMMRPNFSWELCYIIQKELDQIKNRKAHILTYILCGKAMPKYHANSLYPFC